MARKRQELLGLARILEILGSKLTNSELDSVAAYNLLLVSDDEFFESMMNFLSIDTSSVEKLTVNNNAGDLKNRIFKSLFSKNLLRDEQLSQVISSNPNIDIEGALSQFSDDTTRQKEASAVLGKALLSLRAQLKNEIMKLLDSNEQTLEHSAAFLDNCREFLRIVSEDHNPTAKDIGFLRMMLQSVKEAVSKAPFRRDVRRGAVSVPAEDPHGGPLPPPPPPPSTGLGDSTPGEEDLKSSLLDNVGRSAYVSPRTNAILKPKKGLVDPVADHPSSSIPPSAPSTSPKLVEFDEYEQDLIGRIRTIEESLPALSEADRNILGAEIENIQAVINQIKALADQMDPGKGSTEIDDLKQNAQAFYNSIEEVKIQPNGISIGGKSYTDFLADLTKHKKTGRAYEKAHQAYEIEKRKYESKLDDLRSQQQELDDKEAEFAKQKKSFEQIKDSAPPSPVPDENMLKQKEQELADIQEDLKNRRFRLSIEKESAGSMLVSLTKMYGGYDLGQTTTLKMYRGGNLGFDTRVMSRAAATKVGLLNDALGGMDITQTDGNSYAAKVHLASNEVIVSTKSYGDAQVVIVKEPNVVRDMSPKGRKLTPEEMKQKALQMAIMFAVDYKQGKPAIIRGGDPELRKLAHAYLLALKYASQEGKMEMKMNWLLSKTPTSFLTKASNKLSGKQLADIDLKDLQVLSDVGPEQYGSGMLDRVKRGVHSVDYAQKTRDMAFVDKVLGPLSGTTFEVQKQEYLSLRDQRALKDSSKDDITFVEAPQGPTKK